MQEIAKGSNLPLLGLVAFALVSPISIAATNAAWVAALLLWGYRRFSEGPISWRSLPRTDLDAALATFFLASLVSLWTSQDPLASIVEFRSLGLMVVFFLFCWNTKTDLERKRLIACLVASTTLAALFGIVQYATGWDFTGHFDPQTRRASAFFGLHLTFGEYLVLVTSLVGGILLFGAPSPVRRASGLGLLLIMVAGILASGSKGSLLGLLVGGLVLFSLRGWRALVSASALGAGLIVLILLFVPPEPLRFVASEFRVDSTKTIGSVDSNTQRVYMWWAGLRISTHYLLQGVGLHSVEAVYPAFRHPLARDANQWHLHNQYLQIGVTRGLFGLVSLIYIFLSAFRAGFRRFKACPDPWTRGLSAGVLAGLAGFLVCGLTEYCWGDSEVLMLVYMLLGLLVSIRVSEPAQGSPPGPVRPERSTRGPVARGVGTGVIGFVAAGLVLAAFAVPAMHDSVRMRILQAALGVALLGLSTGSRWGARLGEGRTRLLVTCILVFAAYAFTRTFWSFGEGRFAHAILTLACPAGAVLCLLTATVLGAGLGFRRLALTAFDISVLSASVLWVGTAMGTNLLLGAATGTGALWDPPFVILLPLVTLILCVYWAVRVFYTGGRVGRGLNQVLAIVLMIHALR